MQQGRGADRKSEPRHRCEDGPTAVSYTHLYYGGSESHLHIVSHRSNIAGRKNKQAVIVSYMKKLVDNRQSKAQVNRILDQYDKARYVNDERTHDHDYTCLLSTSRCV